MSSQPPSGAYPRQELTEQHVEPGRSHLRAYLVLAVVLVLIVAAVGSWLLLRDDGEDQRAEYCAALRELTAGGDLTSALGDADASTLDQFEAVARLAPASVEAEWVTLSDVLDSAMTSQSADPASLLKAYGAFTAIARDASDKCGLTIDVPSF